VFVCAAEIRPVDLVQANHQIMVKLPVNAYNALRQGVHANPKFWQTFLRKVAIKVSV
jgi:hypothetical protein